MSVSWSKNEYFPVPVIVPDRTVLLLFAGEVFYGQGSDPFCPFLNLAQDFFSVGRKCNVFDQAVVGNKSLHLLFLEEIEEWSAPGPARGAEVGVVGRERYV